MRTEEGDTVALEVTSIEKDLGVHMDNKLAFKDHKETTVKPKSHQSRTQHGPSRNTPDQEMP